MPTQTSPEFREVFRNRYATGFSVGALLMMVYHLVGGLVFSAVLVVGLGYVALALVYMSFGFDPLGLKFDIPAGPMSLGDIAGGIASFVVWFCLFAYLGPHSLIRFKRRLSIRLHVLAGRPLASVEGKPSFDPDTESGYSGIQIGEFYFDFNDCSLDIEDGDLSAIERAGGTMRIWYVPTGMRTLTQPSTGKDVKYDCVLVRAETRPTTFFERRG